MQQFDSRTWGRWVLSFVGFPLAGLAARAAAGPIDSATAAVVGGLAAGATLGAVQALARPQSATARARWIAASAFGLSVGLTAGAATAGFDTDTSSLVMMGALSGAGIGTAQAVVLQAGTARRAAWALATPVLWALGWLITAQVIVDADRQHANFGASGALVVAALSGIILAVRPADRTSTPAVV